jgi:hypothetical protein
MPCQGEHVGKPATYGHTIGFLLGTHDHWRNYCGSPSDWIQTSHKKLAAVTNRPWYIFGRTNQPIAWEHAAQTNPYRISIHRRALDSGHIALCHLWATKWLCSRDFLFQNARNDPFLWTCMTGLRWWWLRHSMYPQNLEKNKCLKDHYFLWVECLATVYTCGATHSKLFVPMARGHLWMLCTLLWILTMQEQLFGSVPGVRDHMGRRLGP